MSAETFRRMLRSDHRNSLVRMGTHQRNDDQSHSNWSRRDVLLGWRRRRFRRCVRRTGRGVRM